MIDPATIGLILSGLSVAGSAFGGGGQPGPAFNSKSVDRRFKSTLRSGFDLFNRSLLSGVPGFQGLLAAPLSGFEQSFIGQLPAIFGDLSGILHPTFAADLLTNFQRAREPFVQGQIATGKASIRESEALGGNLFSTGRIGRESDLVSQILAGEAQAASPFAAQLTLAQPQLALQGAQTFTQALPILGQLASLPRAVQQEDINRQIAEFIRTQPESLLPLLVSLATGAPQAQIQPPNALGRVAPALAGLGGGLLQFGESNQLNTLLAQLSNAGLSGRNDSGLGQGAFPTSQSITDIVNAVGR